MIGLNGALSVSADGGHTCAGILTTMYSVFMRFEWQHYIQADPRVMMGKPVFAGTRIPVDLVLERISSGETLESILEAYPRLTREAILASFAFVSHWMRSDVVYPTPANA